MSTDDRISIPPSVGQVLSYFVTHPGAAGSVRDLADTRIAQEIALHNLAQVREAVEWLLERKLLVHKFDPVLTLNADAVEEAEALLEQLKAPAPVVTPSSGPEASAHAVAAGPRLVDRPAVPPPPVSTLLASCLAWVDATLLRYHRENPLSAADHPGLSRDVGTVTRLLQHDPDSKTAGDDAHDLALIEALTEAPDHEPLARLCRRLALSPVEFKAVLLCLAAEIDAKYQTVFGILNDDLHGRRCVTLGLLCRLLGEPRAVRQKLEETGALARWRLIDHSGVLPHAEESLRLDPVVVSWLFGQDVALTADSRLVRFVRHRPWAGATWLERPEELDLVARLRGVMAGEADDRRVVIAPGDRNGSRAAIEAAARLSDLELLRIVLPSPGPSDPAEIAETSTRIARAARLLSAVPVIDTGAQGSEGLGAEGLTRLLGDLSGTARPLIVVTGDVERIVQALPRSRGHFIQIDLPLEGALDGVYAAAAREAGLEIDEHQAERLALAYPMSLERIEDALWLAILNGTASLPPRGHFAALSTACRRVASPELPRFGRRVEPVFQLRDVVLPDDQRAQLGEIVAHVRHAGKVMNAWGFGEQLPYGRGVTALFSGPSGVGKTMCAQAIARELDTDAYVVDLSRVVSKYIGESEKNLDTVFTDAERAGAVLCFDEADALFGKRSEIKDAHDRYANIEVAFLLQRMEAFSGLAILTTNFRQNLDPAFVRRLRFIVDFRRPDEAGREAIWRRSLVAPLAADGNIRFLARRLDLTGGTIQQIAIRAAFAAAAAGSSMVDMHHVMTAARAELLKLGLTATERELAAFDPTVRRGQGAA